MTINHFDYLAIKNVLSRYCQALDTKSYDVLHKVFLPDVTANYPFNSDMKGVEEIKEAIKSRLGPIVTQHSLTTQSIAFRSDDTAEVETYFIGLHFGQGPHEGEVLSIYGIYKDEVVRVTGEVNGDDGVPGASGNWRIKTRVLNFTKRLGDENIMKEF